MSSPQKTFIIYAAINDMTNLEAASECCSFYFNAMTQALNIGVYCENDIC